MSNKRIIVNTDNTEKQNISKLLFQNPPICSDISDVNYLKNNDGKLTLEEMVFST